LIPGREAIRDFYDTYYAALDDGDLAAWPGLFTSECIYRVIPRENFEAGRTLSTMQAESRGMLMDRVAGLTGTQVYAPRYYRRFPGPLRLSIHEHGVACRHNLLLVQTLQDRQSDIVLAADCRDVLVVDEECVRLRERIVIFDSEMVPNSLIFPA